jgi:hypothetical protein
VDLLLDSEEGGDEADDGQDGSDFNRLGHVN